MKKIQVLKDKMNRSVKETHESNNEQWKKVSGLMNKTVPDLKSGKIINKDNLT